MTRDLVGGRLGVAIVTFNSAEVVSAALDALPPQLLRRTVVVDNNSLDATVQVVQPYVKDGLHLVRLDENIGFGSAVNRAAQALSDVSYLLVLNPDAMIGADDLERLATHLDEHPRCGVVAPRLWCGDKPLSAARRLPSLASVLWPVAPAALAHRLPNTSLPPSYSTSGPVGAVEGACMLLRLSAFGDVGGFDEGYFLYFEELDLAMRLRELGMTSDLCAGAGAQHSVGNSRASVSYEGAPYFVASTLRFLRKWHPTQALAYPPLARAAWALRSRFGGLDPDLASAYRRALGSPGTRP